MSTEQPRNAHPGARAFAENHHQPTTKGVAKMFEIITLAVALFAVTIGPREYNVIDGHAVPRQNAPAAPTSSLQPIATANAVALQQKK